jgi:rfaE bifunctional protein nucleotidyltransferase chain/domain/rfaE bifunctional protein kinase chain/domain
MSSRQPVLVIGDALLDRDVEGSVERLCPDAPAPVLDERTVTIRPGGAALAAALAAAGGCDTILLCATGRDAAGAELRGSLERHGVELIDLGLEGPTPEKIRLIGERRPLLRLDRGGATGAPVGALNARARAAIGWAGAVLVSDYGRGLTAQPDLLGTLARRCREHAPTVWDPHPRGSAPPRSITVATPNETELAHFAPAAEGLPARAMELARRWHVEGLSVTRGAHGALLVRNGERPLNVTTTPVTHGDTCGAGDCFASACAAALADGADLPSAVRAAVDAASAFVEAGGAGAALAGRAAGAAPSDRAELAMERVRQRGGTVVATGGCFDLLHAGHLATLEAARALGDCLIVCMNSDASVRRIKGPARPLVGAEDRAALLDGLRCVDGVVIFDENDPRQVLAGLRPDIWAKGGDYEGRELPEADLLSTWGGRAAVLPYLDGHSTTELIKEAGYRAAS